ncbi:PDZ domain-containing protein [Neomicrococcus lactis]|uniref:YlbL family protein n=1 Tax=Neomicrococcus lactis TaxID=732241 RepID=UPI0023010E0D|nr:S16 family serine protease [Neomicrococcus lactis]
MQEQKPSRSTRSRLLWIPAMIGAVALVLPSPYVIESPGPALNTIGQYQGKDLFTIDGHETYPTDGNLDMTTVYVAGGTDRSATTAEVVNAWLNPQADVQPEDYVYPRGTSQDAVNEENATQMTDSQQDSIAAALSALKISFDQEIKVGGFASDLNKSTVKKNDVLLAINSVPITGTEQFRQELQKRGDQPSELTVRRDGKETRVTIKTQESPENGRVMGIYLGTSYTFPFKVNFILDNVGGPSAGMMFALGIYDKLTPGSMTGGQHIAGTGTIDAGGHVGPIGGIAQKLVGAKNAGAKYFLAPAENCEDVVGRIPDGLQVVKVATLTESIAAVETIAKGGDTSGLAQCTAP